MPYLKRKTVERERVVRDILIKPADEKKIETTILKSKLIIPSAIAQQLGLRVSIVKRILAQLEKEGKIQKYASSARIKIYVPAEGGKTKTKKKSKSAEAKEKASE
ncbi:MAG: hypothetical protein J7L47_03335 [Candidatus Odinarchaeota archaeon]|nr:hypothetical protein [Candidatus Odinarchaeota archaeon]